MGHLHATFFLLSSMLLLMMLLLLAVQKSGDARPAVCYGHAHNVCYTSITLACAEAAAVAAAAVDGLLTT
jgi:hypothetical protein